MLCCDIDENLPHPVYDRLFYRGVSPRRCKLWTFFCVVQRCSNISLMGSLEEIMFNLSVHFMYCTECVLYM